MFFSFYRSQLFMCLSAVFIHCHQQKLLLEKSSIVSKHRKILPTTKDGLKKKSIHEGWVLKKFCSILWAFWLSELTKSAQNKSTKEIVILDGDRMQPPAAVETTLQLHCAMWRIVWVSRCRNTQPCNIVLMKSYVSSALWN